jgi:capsular exopolysaccharide synthesis family protein
VYAETSETAGVAEIRTLKLDTQKPVLLFDDQHRKASEQYRIIRTKIVQHPKRPKVIVVSSGTPGDGKTFNAINLAGVLSFKEDCRVLLIDGDLRRSSIAPALGIPNRPGLGEVLRGKSGLRSALVRIETHPNLYVLPAGEPEDRPAELLDSPAWPAMLDIFRKRFSYIIVDAPPVAAVADYDLIQAPCDGVIIVVRQDYTNRSAFAKAVGAVAKEKRLGVILNSAEDWWFARQSGYYYYGSYENYYVVEKPTSDPPVARKETGLLSRLFSRFRRE